MASVPKSKLAGLVNHGAKIIEFLPPGQRLRGSMTRPLAPWSFSNEVHPTVSPALVDTRFKAFLAPADWIALSLAIQRRFAKRVCGGESTIYRGQVLETRMSRVGRWLTQLARLVGAHLPLSCDTNLSRSGDGKSLLRVRVQSCRRPASVATKTASLTRRDGSPRTFIAMSRSSALLQSSRPIRVIGMI